MLRNLIPAALLVAVFAAPAQEDEGRTWFSLNSSRTVRSGETAHVSVSVQGARELEFRLYRVNNVQRFFTQLPDGHNFGGQPPRRGRARTFLEKYSDWKTRTRAALRNTLRYQFTPDNRAGIRSWLNSQEQPKQEVVKPGAQGKEYAGISILNPQQLVRRWRQPMLKQNRWDNVTVPVQLAQRGVYVLEATDGRLQAYTMLIATDIAIITKAAPGRLMVRVVDRESGAPLDNVPVTFIDARELAPLASENTREGGMAERRIDNPVEEGIRVLARRGDDIALAEVSGWALGLSSERSLTGVIYTDRPVYRPGHTVHFKAIARRLSGTDYGLPAERAATVEIQDGEGKQVLCKELRFSSLGTAASELALPAGAALGYYSIQLATGTAGGEASLYGGFQVEEYRKPEYEVRVTPASPRILQGSQNTVTIEARYYYGEPVAGAKVSYAIRRNRAYLFADEDEVSSFGGDESGYSAEQISENTGQLDEQGKLTIQVPASRSEFEARFFVEVRVTDQAGREITGAGGFLATRGEFMIQTRPLQYVYQETQPVSVEVSTIDFDGKPVPDVDVTVSLSEHRWNDQKPRAPFQTQQVKTDSAGKAIARFPALDGGSYQIRGVAGPSDDTSYLWIAGAGSWATGSQQESIQIVPDKGSYQAGDTARLLLIPGKPGAHVWLTVEGKSLYYSKLLEVPWATATVEIPVEQSWEPNVFATAVMIHSSTTYRGMKMLKVPAKRRKLDVQVTADKPQYQPGDQAQLTVSAKDFTGKPVQAEFSLGVVDEAIYAIRPDAIQPLDQIFFGRTYNRVQTEDSLDYYFFGEAGRRRMQLAGMRPPGVRGQLKPPRPVEPKVRKLFPDTALWLADLNTGSDGSARTSVTWPDALTTWRATARGIADGTRVGQAIGRTVVRKNLMVSLATPRFFGENDEVVVPVLVRNYYDQPKKVTVSLDVKGAAVVSGGNGDYDVPAKGETRIDYRFKAGSEGPVVLTAKALSTVESDALELTVPVEPAGVLLSGASASASDSNTQLSYAFPPNSTPRTRQLTLSLTPSVAGAIFGALDYLISYPYGCVEQTMSSFLPNLAVTEALKELGLKSPVDQTELRLKTIAGIDRLAGFQHEDGGWGWWRGDDTHPFMTAYVAAGLRMASMLGYPVPHQALGKALQSIQQQYDKDKMPPDTRAYQFYVLAWTGMSNPARLERAWAEKDKLTPFGQSLLGLGLLEVKDPRAADIAATLGSSAIRESGLVHWNSSRDPMLDFDADNSHEATAFVVRFLARQNPQSPLLAPAARWLVERRSQGYYWETTKRTAFVVLGLTGYLKQSGELKPDFTSSIKLADRTLLEAKFTPENVLSAPPPLQKVPAADLPPSGTVIVEKGGEGRIYAGLRWEARVPGENLQLPAGNGLTLERAYFRLTPDRSGSRITWNPEPLAGPAQPGDLLAVRLTVASARERQYILIDDPLPSGTETLKREDLYEIKGGDRLFRTWWSRREDRDSRVTFFPSWLAKGTTQFTYLLKVTHQGTFHVSPARIEPMYEPGTLSSSAGDILEVTP